MAQKAADEAAATNTLRSVDSSEVGQNMAAMTGGELTGEKASTMWYEEVEKYNYSNAGFNSNTGKIFFSTYIDEYLYVQRKYLMTKINCGNSLKFHNRN